MVNYTFTFDQIEYLLIIFIRITCFVAVAPFFGNSAVPNRTKIGFSAFLAIMLSFVVPKPTLEYSTVIQYAIIVLKEAIVGLLIGFAANIATSIVTFAGKIIDTDMGLSMMTMFDPQLKEQASVTGLFYNYLIMLMLIVTSMDRFILRALIDSYSLVPVNQAIFNYDNLLKGFLAYMEAYLVIGFRIALPIFASILIVNVVLGILAKVAPQMNMFAVGIQIKMLAGLMIMTLIIMLIPSVSNFIFTEMKTLIVLMIEGMK
ncbi:MAG: flagellar biosynthetic protein FliR [Lachnospiraceae bacterium]|nr:flagellar biosynthetic protein FliR [Lachnospiraceae bacterium]